MMGSVDTVFSALNLPSASHIDMRVPKKVLVEQIAPTTADKRVIQDGIDELQWRATCKPSTVGIPAFSDFAREYLEIAVIACVFRPGARSSRLVELIHRGIPYPVFLITRDAEGVTVSVAHKRNAQNEADKVVVERVVSVDRLKLDASDPAVSEFLRSLPVARQPKVDLFSLYEGWLTRIEALNAARLAGSFVVADDKDTIERRRGALEAHSRLTREITGLRAKAVREKQLNRRVELNLKIQRLEAELAAETANL